MMPRWTSFCGTITNYI